MGRRIRKYLAGLLCVCLLLGTLELPAAATQTVSVDAQTKTGVWVNPIYEDAVSEEMKAEWLEIAENRSVDINSAIMTDSQEAAEDKVRNSMVAREESCTISFTMEGEIDSDAISEYCGQVIEDAYADDPAAPADEGDYLLWHLSGYGYSMSMYSSSGIVNVTCTYAFGYRSTAEQEQAVTAKLPEVYEELGLSELSGEAKIGKIYDYITNHVTYDYEHLELGASEYPTAWTAYGGLIDGTCVCQGYATLLYRMMKESGIPVRVITGYAGEAHAWNIVAIDGLYYNMDATWDGYTVDSEGNVATAGRRDWYLLSTSDFGSHTRGDEYLTTEFQEAHPMAGSSYGQTSNDSDSMLEVGNLSYTFNTSDGGTVSTTASDGQCVLLVFGSTECGNTKAFINSLISNDIVNNDKVRNIFVDIKTHTQSQVATFKEGYSAGNMSFCYDESSTASGAMWAYYRAVYGSTSSVSLPVVVLIDSDNVIRYLGTGGTSSATVKDYLGRLLEYEAPVIGGATVSVDGITLTWNAVDSARKYCVYRRSKVGAEYVAIATVEDTSYTDQPAAGNYSYAISAVFSGIEGPKSTAVDVQYERGGIDKVTLSAETVSLFSFQEQELTATAVPVMEGDTVDQTVTWTSSDESIVTVKDGKLTGVKTGTATITATSTVDTDKQASCAVTVLDDYTITYELNGGTLENANPTAYNPYYPDLELNAPTKEGCTFMGWYRDAEFAEDSYMENIPTGSDYGNLTLYAKWKDKATVAAPVASVDSGCEVETGTKVKLSCETLDAVIYYTLDGTDPDKNSTRYTDAIVIEQAMELRAIAVKEGFKDSAVAVFVYTIKDTSTDLGDVLPEDVPEQGIPEGLWVAGVKDAVYSGKAVTFDLRVYFNKKLLTEKTDYTVSYKNNKSAAAATDKKAPAVTVTGKGNYKDKVVKNFTIEPLSIAGEEFSVETVAVVYNGKTQNPVPVLYRNGSKLKVKKDYKVSYPDKKTGAYVESGTYQILIEGCGNYGGNITGSMIITEAALMSKTKISAIPAQTYNGGKAIEPAITVKMGSETIDSSMYTVHYENHYNIGTATVRVVGDGVNYVGEKRATFKITGVPMSKVKVEGFVSSLPYTGTAVTQSSVKLTYTAKDAKPVTLGKDDYTVTYTKNMNAGTATVIFTGQGMYTGSLKKTFKITPYEIDKAQASTWKVNYSKSVPYAKGGGKPEIQILFGGQELVAGKDYTVSYKNNTALYDGSNAGKVPTVIVKGKGNFKGIVSYTFKIVKQDITLMNVQVADKVFANKSGAYKSVPKVYDLDGKVLKAGTDYEKQLVYYYDEDTCLANGTLRLADEVIKDGDIVPQGTVVRVEIIGKGNYEANKVCGKYRIIKADISKATVSVEPQVYTGKAVEPAKSQIHITLKGETLSAGDYEIVSYSNNIKKGTATMVLRGVGEYGGQKTVKFVINAKSFLDAGFYSFDFLDLF